MTRPPGDRTPTSFDSAAGADAGALTVRQLGERALIERIRSMVPAGPPWVAVGIGDDAAVVEPARNTVDVLTTDALVEGIHIDWRYMSAGDVGHKLLAVNLSDLAAMGAAPRAALLSLALPGTLPVGEVDALVGALLELAARHGVALVGGNITASPGPFMADLTLVGSVRRRRVLRRSAGRAGDELWVSGTVGGQVAALGWLQERAAAGRSDAAPEPIRDAVNRFLRPEPRVRLGLLIGRNRAALACMDLSDGLGDAVRAMAESSGVGATLDAEALPIDQGARWWAAQRGLDPVELALTGGEEYELLVAVPRRTRSRFESARRLARQVPLTRIGHLTPEPGVRIRRDGHTTAPVPAGFAHFGQD